MNKVFFLGYANYTIIITTIGTVILEIIASIFFLRKHRKTSSVD